MFFAAPMPTGIEIAMPTTVETTVIQRLSAIPSTISSQRLAKSGGKNDDRNAAPRGRPSHTRVQLTGVVCVTSAKYTTTPISSVHRNQADLISGGFFQVRGRAATHILSTSGRPCGPAPAEEPRPAP